MKPIHQLVCGLATALFLMSASGVALAADKSLYDRLGGNAAITAVVEDFTANVAADARINKFFANADMVRVKAKLVEQIGAATGGPEKYTGRSMKEVHNNMGVTDAHFTALVEDLVKTLNKFKVPAKEQGELLTILGSLKPDIVQTKG
jgi:hemoglobin